MCYVYCVLNVVVVNKKIGSHNTLGPRAARSNGPAHSLYAQITLGTWLVFSFVTKTLTHTRNLALSFSPSHSRSKGGQEPRDFYRSDQIISIG